MLTKHKTLFKYLMTFYKLNCMSIIGKKTTWSFHEIEWFLLFL